MIHLSELDKEKNQLLDIFYLGLASQAKEEI